MLPESLSVVLWLASQGSATGQEQKLLAEELPVHASPSASSRVIRTLQPNRGAIVEIRVEAKDGTWCGLRPESRGESGGWVLCSRLTESSAPGAKQPSWRLIQAEPEEPLVAPAPASPDKPDVGLPIPPSPEEWMSALNFSAQQSAQIHNLLESSGVGACRRSLAAQLQRMGIVDADSLLRRMPRTLPELATSGAAVDALLGQCAPRYQAFWKAFDGLMTSEQEIQARRDPRFLLSRSVEPELMIFGDVFRFMWRTGMTDRPTSSAKQR